MMFNSKAVQENVQNKQVQNFHFSDFWGLRTTFQFDELYTLKVLAPGSSPKKYYANVSCLNFVEKVDIPALFLHSKNDPICL